MNADVLTLGIVGGIVADEFWLKEQLAGREVYNKILKELGDGPK